MNCDIVERLREKLHFRTNYLHFKNALFGYFMVIFVYVQYVSQITITFYCLLQHLDQTNNNYQLFRLLIIQVFSKKKKHILFGKC